MFSDESSSRSISTISNPPKDGRQKIEHHMAEQWEINLIGNFLLDLYHRSILTIKEDWCIKKVLIRELFSKTLNVELEQKLERYNIGTLLNNCGFLTHTKRGTGIYKIKHIALYEFRNNKLNQLDNRRKTCDAIELSVDSNMKNNSNLLEKGEWEIEENEEKKFLEYQGTTMQRRETTFCSTNMSCFICQENFYSMESFEEHIAIHGDDTNFEYLSKLDKCEPAIFSVNYRLCKNSHFFCFELESNLKELVIEKIIVVQSRSFFYVHDIRVPYNYSGNAERVFLDCHLFTRHVEQPIVLICHLAHSNEMRIIEQHHFMRSEEFPKVNFPINPYRLPYHKQFKPILVLNNYYPPSEIQSTVNNKFYKENLMSSNSAFREYLRVGKKLQPHTMVPSLKIMLQIEDIDILEDYINLKQTNIQLRSFGNEYSFQVNPTEHNYLENLLSINDELLLTTRNDIFINDRDIRQLIVGNMSKIRVMNMDLGIVQAVNAGRVSFKCYKKLDLCRRYTVICRPARTNFRYQYRALEILEINMKFFKNFLFPTKIPPMPLASQRLNLYNDNINEEQLQAVCNIAEGPRNDATYIIFGPPGTGKTTTLVEAILQLLRKPDTKIVVTAASNSACDEVALRLIKFIKRLDINRCMVRIYARSSEIRSETLDEELLENSNMYNGQFYPDIEILHEYRIVICTFSVLAKLGTGKFGRKEKRTGLLYTHLFIDEVAAATEVESLIAISTILTPGSHLIISGDHKQLGPILQSNRAKGLGLGVSLMDRLLARDCYAVDMDTGHYDQTIQTRLFRNYRSHSAIVNLYSGLYYNNSLVSKAKPEDVSLCEIWHKCRNKQFPILFHAAYGPIKRDDKSHSLYNHIELQLVMDYVQDLMHFGINGQPVKETDIGIISPYKKQYQCIKEELNLRKWFNIETGSVEIFQGKEKNIIIASFVRSGQENLGFLANPRRLNVTLSRAKSILILIGNPKTLSLNKDFKYIIKECQRHKTFIESSTPKYRGISTDLSNKMENLKVLDNKKDGNKNEDQPCTSVSAAKRRGCRGGRRRRRRAHHNGTHGKNTTIDKNVNENNNAEYKDVDDDDDDEDESVDNGDDEPNSLEIEWNSKMNSTKGYDKQQSGKAAAANASQISIEHAENKHEHMGYKNENLQKPELDLLFNGLPQVPQRCTQPYANFNTEELSQNQTHQYAYNFQPNEFRNNYNPLLNAQAGQCGYGQSAPAYRFTNQRQQYFNSMHQKNFNSMHQQNFNSMNQQHFNSMHQHNFNSMHQQNFNSAYQQYFNSVRQQNYIPQYPHVPNASTTNISNATIPKSRCNTSKNNYFDMATEKLITEKKTGEVQSLSSNKNESCSISIGPTTSTTNGLVTGTAVNIYNNNDSMRKNISFKTSTAPNSNVSNMSANIIEAFDSRAFIKENNKINSTAPNSNVSNMSANIIESFDSRAFIKADVNESSREMDSNITPSNVNVAHPTTVNKSSTNNRNHNSTSNKRERNAKCVIS